MNTKLQATIQGKHGKSILVDSHFKNNNKPKSIIIFCHGYKGFKDWGAWNIMADAFAKEDFYFIKFNFSHNGGTIEQPIDFPDLEAFGNNNYIIELDDLESVIDWIFNNNDTKINGNLSDITLIGHSRGGGIVLIKAEEDTRVKKVISLAGVSDYASRFPKGDHFNLWKETGVSFVKNGRTKQEMPHYFQFYTNFIKNKERLTISRAVKKLETPHLIIHGDADASVKIEEAYQLKKWNPKSSLSIIKDANHVFGISHSLEETTISIHLNQVITETINFIRS